MLIAMAGLPATGKSTIAARLAHELDGVVLSKDQVRAALFPRRHAAIAVCVRSSSVGK